MVTHHFPTARFGQYRWLLRQDVNLETIEDLLSDPERFLQPPARHFKSSKVVTIAQVPSETSGRVPLILRRLNYGKLSHQIRDWLRPSRAHRAFFWAWKLEQLHVTTPRAAAAATVRLGTWPRRAYLITEEVSEASNCKQLLEQGWEPPAEAMERLAYLLAVLHNHRIRHRDLKPSNIMFQEEISPFLIDLDGLRKQSQVGLKDAAEDFVPLARTFSRFPGVWEKAGGSFTAAYCGFRQWPGRGEALYQATCVGCER